MKAMVMAAGYGTRLGKITETCPKILIDIGGTTPLEWILRKLKSSGFSEVIINLHYLPELVLLAGKRLAGELGMKLFFSFEKDKLLDTGGGLYHAREFLNDKPFLLYNGDIISDIDLACLYDFGINSDSIVTLAIRNRQGKRVFLFDTNGYLGGWRNTETGETIITRPDSGNLTETAFSAIAVIKPEIFSYMEEGIYSLRPVYLKLSEKKLVDSFRHDTGYWIDIGRPQGLESCRKMLLNQYRK